MKVLWAKRVDSLARQLLPLASTIVILIAGVIPLHVPNLPSISPALSLVCVFYWTLHRPGLMPPFAAFALGLLQDILAGLPLGGTSLVMLFVHAITTTQRRFFEHASFGIMWLSFALLVTAALALGWVLACGYYGVLIAPGPVVIQGLMTIGCFPLLYWTLDLFQQATLPKN